VMHLDDQANQCFEDISWNEEGDEGLIKEFVQVCATGKNALGDRSRRAQGTGNRSCLL
jgi:hypothetical protein